MESVLVETWDAAGIQLKNRNKEFKTTCPKCSEQRRNKKDPCLRVNPSEGVWFCHHCGYKGAIKSDLNTKAKSQKPTVYAKPPYNSTELSNKTMEWFASRGLNQTTLRHFKITESVEFIASEKHNCINFNYFRDSELINIKFRDGAKNFKMVAGAELIFYNLDSLKKAKLCYITEGEMDALTVWQCMPDYAVVSVPNGAQKSGRLEYLDNCWEHFEHLEKIVLATDTDAPGLILREELARRLGKERCYFPQYPEDCKDINEVLLKHDCFSVQDVLLNVHPYPIEGVLTVVDIEDDIDYIYEHGYPKGDKVGFFSFDTLLSFRRGELTIVTGIPNSGKSEFIDEIAGRLVEKHNWMFGVYSAENQPVAIHFSKIAERYIGRKLHHDNKAFQMNPDELVKAKKFVNDSFYFINVAEYNLSIPTLIEKAGQLVKSKGITGFIIDPWNYLEHIIPKGFTETQYINQALTELCNAAKRLNIHIFLIAHPTKLYKDKKTGKFEIPTLYQISGSAHFFNKADNGISVYRDDELAEVIVYVQKVRFKWIGKKGEATFRYDFTNGRYKEI